MNLKKLERYLRVNVGTGPSSYEKKNLPDRGLTKVEKQWIRLRPLASKFSTVHRPLTNVTTQQNNFSHWQRRKMKPQKRRCSKDFTTKAHLEWKIKKLKKSNHSPTNPSNSDTIGVQFLLLSTAELTLGHRGTTKYVGQNISYYVTLNLNDRSK
jgi:hypothetical protein